MKSSSAPEQVQAYEDELLGDDIPDDLPLDDLPPDDLLLDDLPFDDLPLDDLPPDDLPSNEKLGIRDQALGISEEGTFLPDSPPIEMEEDGGGISLGNSEMLEILSEALGETKEYLSTALEKIVTLSPGDSSFEEAAENYVDDVQRLWTAAEMMGLEGLQTICTFVSDNIKVLATQDLGARQKAQPVLAAWPDLVLSYLNAPSENVIPMLNHFRESEWAKPLPDEQAHSLLQQLTQGSTAEEVTEEEEAYQCPTMATAEDVIIDVPEDINPELLEAYLTEAPQHAAEFSECIQSIIQDPQVAEIHRAQRIAHTLKGSSNIIGINCGFRWHYA